MGQLRDRMDAHLRLGGYRASTRKIHLCYARLSAKHFMRSPAEMGEAEVRCFLLHLIEERRASRETVRQVRAALAFLERRWPERWARRRIVLHVTAGDLDDDDTTPTSGLAKPQTLATSRRFRAASGRRTARLIR